MNQLDTQKAGAIFALLRGGVKKEPAAVLLGDILQEVMNAKGLGVGELARLLGTSSTRVSRVLNEGEEVGGLKASTLDELAELTEELGWIEMTDKVRLKARMRRRETSKRGGWR